MPEVRMQIRWTGSVSTHGRETRSTILTTAPGETYDSSSDAFGAELAVGCGWPVLDSQCPRSRPEPHGVRGTACASYPAAAHPGGDVCAFVVPVAAGWAARKTFRSRSFSHSRSGGGAGRPRHSVDDLGATASRPLLERQGRDQNEPPTHQHRPVCEASPSDLHGDACRRRRYRCRRMAGRCRLSFVTRKLCNQSKKRGADSPPEVRAGVRGV